MPNTLPAALAFTIVLWGLWHFVQNRMICVSCGGWNEHRKGCPFKREDQ